MEQRHEIFSFNSKRSAVWFIPVGWFTSACVSVLQMLKPPSISPCFFLFLSTNFLCLLKPPHPTPPPLPLSKLRLWTFFKSGFKPHKTSVLMLGGFKARGLCSPYRRLTETGFHSKLQSEAELHHLLSSKLIQCQNFICVRRLSCLRTETHT